MKYLYMLFLCLAGMIVSENTLEARWGRGGYWGGYGGGWGWGYRRPFLGIGFGLGSPYYYDPYYYGSYYPRRTVIVREQPVVKKIVYKDASGKVLKTKYVRDND